MNKRSLIAKHFIILFLPLALAAQRDRTDDTERKEHAAHHHHYKFIDLGTLGGPHSYGSPNGPGSRLINNAGVVASSADTTAQDPFAAFFCYVPDCMVAHAFRWRHGVMTDLGALDDSYSSAVGSMNDRGWSTGQSETGETDPAFNFPLFHAVLWKGTKMVDIGTLPGGNTSIGISVNNAGQVVGFGNNDVPDPYALFPTATQMRTFMWQHGEIQDIGTLGGPDAAPGPGCNNQRPGVIVGGSYTSFVPNAASGVPTIHPFLWDNGTMTDLGSLGGTHAEAQCTNNRGQVIGWSNLPGDSIRHAFLWQHGHMKDLGTLGGPLSEVWGINDSGEIAGSADLPTPGLHDAVVWRNGRMHDLGTLPGDPCSRAYGLNARGQVVGTSTSCKATLHAFVWQDGGPMMDLNSLIQPGTGYQLTNAIDINDRGEIIAKAAPVGFTPDDDADLGHLALLIPCDDRHSGLDDCDYSEVDPDTVAVSVTNAPPRSNRNSDDEDRPGFGGAFNSRLEHRNH
jgi:probable HAF family extracellular repeat protein